MRPSAILFTCAQAAKAARRRWMQWSAASKSHRLRCCMWVAVGSGSPEPAAQPLAERDWAALAAGRRRHINYRDLHCRFRAKRHASCRASLSKGGWRGAFLMVVRSVFRDPGLISDGEKSKSTISVIWCSRRDRYSRGVNRTVHS